MLLGMVSALNSSCGAEGGGEFKISLDYRAKPIEEQEKGEEE